MRPKNAIPFVALAMFVMTSSAQAAFSEKENVGQKIISHVSTNGIQQICVLPWHFAGANYLPDDDKVEQHLCDIERGTNAAMCAKTSSTNPGIIIANIPDGMTAAAVEAHQCKVPGAKTMAKYKLSTSCSYTPSILGYYHVSRMLGGIDEVSQAVLHTMDRKEHLLMAQDGLKRTPPADIIHKTWATLFGLLAGTNQSGSDFVISAEGDQSYGAFVVQDKKQVKYPELFNRPSAGQTRVQAFMQRNPSYLGLTHAGAITDVVGDVFNTANVQRMTQMRDVADMIVLDTIMSQQDRFGNIDGREEFAFKDATGVHYVRKAEQAGPGAVQVKVMLLRDNDCGVNKTNIEGDAHMVEGIRHISPQTYARLMALNKSALLPSTEAFFKRELVFTDGDYTKFKKNLAHVTAVLNAACHKGTLLQDLDVSAHFGATPAAPVSCD